MHKRFFWAPALAVFALVLAVPSAAAAPWRTFVTTPGWISQLSLDPSGRAAWVQLGGRYHNSCYQIRQGALMRGQSLAVTPCVRNDEGGSQAIMTTVSAGTQRIVWVDHPFGGNTSWGVTLWATTRGGPITRLASMRESCQGGPSHDCWPPGGTELGPMAARDGVLLYSMDTVSVDPNCPNPGYCDGSVTGGRIRRVGFDAAGRAHLTTVPGAPPAALMTTAGGVLAEQPYALNTAQGSPQIQLRNVSTGALLLTIPVNGTLLHMGMSDSELAIIMQDGAGYHLVRYDVHTGARLGSVPLHPGVDPTTLGIYGTRILFQTRSAIRIYHTDLGRVITVARQRYYKYNLSIDCYGVRWTKGPAPGGGAIRGINFR